MRTAASLALAFLAAGASHAQGTNNCEAIRAQIEAKVRASGVSSFTLSVVDADAPASGRVVGSCDLGTKKIMYSASGQAAAPSKPAPSSRDRVITECRDGSVSTGAAGCN